MTRDFHAVIIIEETRIHNVHREAAMMFPLLSVLYAYRIGCRRLSSLLQFSAVTNEPLDKRKTIPDTMENKQDGVSYIFLSDIIRTSVGMFVTTTPMSDTAACLISVLVTLSRRIASNLTLPNRITTLPTTDKDILETSQDTHTYLSISVYWPILCNETLLGGNFRISDSFDMEFLRIFNVLYCRN